MIRAYKQLGVIAGFLVLLILVAAGTLVTQRQQVTEQENYEWVLHTRKVIGEIYRIESLLKDAETGQRGYLYTNNRQYLADYESGASRVPTHLAVLEQLIADNPAQRARISTLRDLTQKKLAELAQTVALQEAGDSAGARAIVSSNQGLRMMDAIRSQLGQMEQEEDSLAGARERAYHRSAKFTEASIVISGAVASLGLILLAYLIFREMELRQKYSTQIREREEWYRLTLTSLGDGVIATDREGAVTFLNPVAEVLTGRALTEFAGRPILEVFPIFNEYSGELVENPVNRVLTEGRIIGLANHTVLRSASGALTPIEDSASPIRDIHGRVDGVVLVFRDATPARKTEELARKAEKLSAAARLAATVSHEINNPLAAIVNLIYLVRLLPDLPVAASEPLDLVERELERVAHITRQTLGFYRESKPPEPVDLAGLVEQVLKLYAGKIQANSVTVAWDFEDCPRIYGVAGELTQAVSNLVLNAIDAVPENGHVRLRLRTVGEPEQRWVQFTVEDDGPGVPDELREKIFEPFFTTKKDVGTGLGLWVTQEIVKRHGGTIEVAARTARGAVFQMRFPVPR